MSDSDSPREIPRPCSLSVGDMRKAVTKARKRNKVTGPARRAEIMDVIEAHIDNLDGTDALEAIMSKTPLNMTDIHMARAEMKRLFHPRASAMKMQDLINYVYWTTKALEWDWQELDGFSQKQRQPRGCRKSQRPGKSLEPPPTATGTIKKRAPSKYNIFLKNWIRANKADKDQHGNPVFRNQSDNTAILDRDSLLVQPGHEERPEFLATERFLNELGHLFGLGPLSSSTYKKPLLQCFRPTTRTEILLAEVVLSHIPVLGRLLACTSGPLAVLDP